MIFYSGLVASVAILAWRAGSNPADAVSFGVAVFLVGLMAGSALSNRVQRRLHATAASWIGHLGFDRREARLRSLAPLRRAGSTAEFLDRLPVVTVTAADVQPVTLFVLDDDGSQYVPVSSTLRPVPCAPIGAEEPLARALRKSRSVHYLRGRADDLENAPIHAVNGQQVEECEAAAGLPLRRDGDLIAFLLCGGTQGRPHMSLQSSASLEILGGHYSSLLNRCPRTERTITGRLAASPVATQTSVSA